MQYILGSGSIHWVTESVSIQTSFTSKQWHVSNPIIYHLIVLVLNITEESCCHSHSHSHVHTKSRLWAQAVSLTRSGNKGPCCLRTFQGPLHLKELHGMAMQERRQLAMCTYDRRLRNLFYNTLPVMFLSYVSFRLTALNPEVVEDAYASISILCGTGGKW